MQIFGQEKAEREKVAVPGAHENGGRDIHPPARRSSWPAGAKYSLWLTASELPLHRVRGRLEVGHLRTRSSQDRYR